MSAGDAAQARILVVDDDERCRRLVRDVLAHHGHAVQACDSGRAGLATMRGLVPALVLLDIQLGDVSGYDVLAAMRAEPRLAGVPVVAMTASVMEADRGRLAAAGFDGFLAKPISLRELVREVRDRIGHPAPEAGSAS